MFRKPSSNPFLSRLLYLGRLGVLLLVSFEPYLEKVISKVFLDDVHQHLDKEFLDMRCFVGLDLQIADKFVQQDDHLKDDEYLRVGVHLSLSLL
jgi:hypothetical protein